jgi:alpha-galactosidase/6-phospho-beta-glucosidase family protein
MTNTMLRIRGQKGMERYDLLIEEQLLVGCDNLLRGKFTKQWKIQQKAYMNRKRLRDPALHARNLRNRKRDEEKNNNKYKGKKKSKTEAFHSFFQAIVPFIKEIWTDRCIDRNTPVVGGRMVAEYDALENRVTQLYTVREMVLPED